MPLGELPVPPSKARRATFWNFARQDYLAACKSAALIVVLQIWAILMIYMKIVMNECQTRLDTDNLDLWREAGLPIDKDGYILFSGIDLDLGPPSERARKSSGHGFFTSSKVSGAKISVKEDMISNALIWLSSRLTNFIAAGEGFAPIPAGDRSESLQEEEPGEYGKSQKSLLEKWKSLAYVFSESMFPLLNHRLSPEECRGRIYSLDIFKARYTPSDKQD